MPKVEQLRKPVLCLKVKQNLGYVKTKQSPQHLGHLGDDMYRIKTEMESNATSVRVNRSRRSSNGLGSGLDALSWQACASLLSLYLHISYLSCCHRDYGPQWRRGYGQRSNVSVLSSRKLLCMTKYIILRAPNTPSALPLQLYSLAGVPLFVHSCAPLTLQATPFHPRLFIASMGSPEVLQSRLNYFS